MRIKVLTEHRTEPCCYRAGETVVFCGFFPGEKRCGAVFYTEGGDSVVVPFPEEAGLGRLYSVRIEGLSEEHDRYRLFCGKEEFADKNAWRLYGLSDMNSDEESADIYGAVLDEESAVIFKARAKGVGTKNNSAPEDDLIYLLHVRGFTMSPGAGVEKGHRGTFLGVADKLDHIESLKATAVELMPAYEMAAMERDGDENASKRVNYWGYKEGYYFAPRSAYSCGDPCGEFKELVSRLHKRHIALIMQFWFRSETPAVYISSVLRHWVRIYGVDGFHLIGGGLNIESIAADPALSGVRMYYESVDEEKIASLRDKTVGTRKLISLYRDDFSLNVRRFLKADNNTVGAFFGSLINNRESVGVVNYLAGYEGFRLVDFVSYEHKHNEANRENNADGPDDNASWNCGVEGRTRRVSVNNLRRKQIFNALIMLFFAQGTPVIYSGDEFLNTQEGNNNPYCQDNAVSWINWRLENTAAGQDTMNFIRFLADYRKKRGMLGASKPLKLMDYKAFGFPDLSSHGTDAWQPDFSAFSHSVGLLFCNLYAREQDPAFIYCIFNCHWEPMRFALPAMPKGLSWVSVIDTSRTGHECDIRKLKGGEKSVPVRDRSCVVLETRGSFVMTDKKGRTPF